MYAAFLNKKLVLAVEEAYLVMQGKKQINSEKYRCPNCQKRVILVVSQAKNAFFKHISSLEKQEGEKEEHHQGKILLKTAFTAAGLIAKNEVSLADGNLRADVLVEDKIALEVQCAPLSQEEFTHRHQLYRGIKILDLWIVGKRHYLTDKIKKTQLIFFRENELWGKYYLEIDSKRQILRLKYNVCQAPLSRQIKYQTKEFILDEKGIKALWEFKPKKVNFQFNPLEQKRFLMQQIKRKTELGLKIGELLYFRKMTIDQLPGWLFVQKREVGEVDLISQYFH